MTVGERIKARRLELGLSVDEVAARLGKNRANVYRCIFKNKIEEIAAGEPICVNDTLSEVR